MQGSYGIDERDWWRGMAVRVVGEGGTPGVGRQHLPIAQSAERRSQKEVFSSFIGKWGRFRNVSGWLGIDEREWWREGAVGVAGKEGSQNLGR